MRLWLQHLNEIEAPVCRAWSHPNRREWAQRPFAIVSRLGDGVVWYSLIAADDEADFASKAIRLLCDAELRATLGEQARACARTWSATALAERMLKLYQAVTGMTRTRAGRPCGSARNA